MKCSNLIFVTFLAFVILLSQSCSTNHATSTNEFVKTPPNKINVKHLILSRYATPNLMYRSVGSRAIGAVGIGFGAIGGAIGGGLSCALELKNGKTLCEKYNLPDFGEMIIDNIIEQKTTKLANWPEITIVSDPVEKEYFDRRNEFLVVIEISIFQFTNADGLSVSAKRILMDSAKIVIAEDTFNYNTKIAQRCCNVDELEADDGKLLYEEFVFAAKRTAKNLMRYPPVEIQAVQQKELIGSNRYGLLPE